MTHDEFMHRESEDDSISLSNNTFSKNFTDNLIKKNLKISPAYWELLNGNYEIIAKRDVKRFISSKGDEFKKFLLFIPKIINKEFMNDKLLLKLSNDYHDHELLKIYIKTSFPPQKTADKINKIEDEVFFLDNHEILNNLEISVEF